MRNFLTCLILALGLLACGSHQPFDINEDDAATSADSTSNADSTASGRDTSTTPLATCEGRCGGAYDKALACQCDAECVTNKDCCGDYQSLCKPSGNCVDNDGDGYCDSAPKQGDCNDKDKNINPGMPEACKSDGTGNGVDENCNGQTDEGCKAASNPVPTSGTATVKVTYPTVRFQQLLVHVWGGSKTFIFSGYEKVVNDTAKVFQASVAVDENACGLTIQSANGSSPATSSFWLCTGPGGIGSLDPDAEVEVTYGGKTYYEADMVPLGAPGGGCAIVVPFKKTGACAL